MCWLGADPIPQGFNGRVSDSFWETEQYREVFKDGTLLIEVALITEMYEYVFTVVRQISPSSHLGKYLLSMSWLYLVESVQLLWACQASCKLCYRLLMVLWPSYLLESAQYIGRLHLTIHMPILEKEINYS